MKKTSLFLFLVSLAAANFTLVKAQYPGQYTSKTATPLKAPIKAYSFDLQDVKLLAGPFKDNMERDAKWLLSIDNKRLLHSFRLNAGIQTMQNLMADGKR